MDKLILFGHGGSGNHGCEAIVRSTAALFPDRPTVLLSRCPEEDRRWGIDALAQQQPVRRCSGEFLRAYAALKLGRDHRPMDALACKGAFAALRPGDVALSIGGDNYCYSENEFHAMLHRLARERGAATVLWGFSLEPEVLRDPATVRDLGQYDLICARDSLSFGLFQQVNPNTVLAADPAFCLEPTPTRLPEGFLPGNTLGLNLSPLVLDRERVSGVVFESCVRLIGQVLAQTSLHIALIPHVVWPFSDDRLPLGRLYDLFRDTGRVCLVSDRSCTELKTVISQCRFFVGARTHAAIAAYSTAVPTLALGYSGKATGIARDLFGTETGYVLPVQQLEDPDALTRAFFAMQEREQEDRQTLRRVLPGIRDRARSAAARVGRLP